MSKTVRFSSPLEWEGPVSPARASGEPPAAFPCATASDATPSMPWKAPSWHCRDQHALLPAPRPQWASGVLPLSTALALSLLVAVPVCMLLVHRARRGLQQQVMALRRDVLALRGVLRRATSGPTARRQHPLPLS